VAELARFYGIVMAVFFREHGVAHVHAFYAEYVASIRISDCVVLEGGLPAPALRLARQWIHAHQEELLEAWTDARNGRKPARIPPLRGRR